MRIDPITSQPSIEAERFVLRPLRRSDAGLIEHFAGDPRVARMTRSVPHPLPPGATEAFIRQSLAEDRVENVWAIDGSAADMGEVLGLIELKNMDRGQCQVAYWVAPACWNTGVASEALRALIAANPQESRQIFAEVFQDNPRSARVLTNCGFDYLGDAEAYSVAREGMVPTWTYALTLSE